MVHSGTAQTRRNVEDVALVSRPDMGDREVVLVPAQHAASEVGDTIEAGLLGCPVTETWRDSLGLLGATVAGMAVGSRIALHVPERLLQRAFASMVLGVGVVVAATNAHALFRGH